MKMIEISVPNLNDSFSRVILDSTAYLIRFTWNETGQYWTFGIYTSLQEPIVQGIKIVPRFPLNLQYIDKRLPNGVLGVYTKGNFHGKFPYQERILRNDFKNGNAVFAYISANQLQ